ncbi:MAG TPA: sulfatase-like hydrolase/transferase, partial [Vicinamibacterales bacterium]|nr:sulfatase-like hydrolase/transferase [Vicinamibacterales bacterium]
MIRWGFIAARALVAAVCLLTWAFGVIVSVRFAFEQFIRPQLFPWVTQFVIWHHVWYWVAYAAGSATLLPQLRQLTDGRTRSPVAWLALGYVICFGAIGVYLITTPYLATLDGGMSSLALVPGALIPLLWLSLIDHAVAGSPAPQQRAAPTSEPRIFSAAIATATSLWAVHVAIAATRSDLSGGWSGWLSTSVWGLVLDVTAGVVLAVVLGLIATIAGTRRRVFAWEHGLVVVLMATVISEFGRQLVLPSLSFTGADAAVIAMPVGLTMALMWSGWRCRCRHAAVRDTALGYLISPFDGRSLRSVLVALLIPVLAAIASRLVEAVDWALIANRLIALVEATLVFGFFLARFRDRQQDQSSSLIRAVVLPLAALCAMALMPRATGVVGATTRHAAIDSELALDRLPTTDPLAATFARLWIEQQERDMDFYRAMIASNTSQSAQRPAVPEQHFAREAITLGPAPPNVFIFLIDSLRRDYLSPYNPAATFTPSVAAFAADSDVFTNAFTTYGGTWMSIPSMWTGLPLTRGWGHIVKATNALEHLITASDYDFVINDYTIEMELKASTQRTFLNPGITSVNTDLCDNVAALQAHIDGRREARSTFAFLAPMNVHILNTRLDAGETATHGGGFYPPYASRLQRLDGCFGSFLAYLRQRGLYDNSIIIFSSDHGDTLGTDGNWGHQFFLFPEDVRIPLIIRLPPAMRA